MMKESFRHIKHDVLSYQFNNRFDLLLEKLCGNFGGKVAIISSHQIVIMQHDVEK